MSAEFERAMRPEAVPDGPAVWLVFQGDLLLARAAQDALALPRGAAPAVDLSERMRLGTWGGLPVIAARAPDGLTTPDGMEAVGLRGLHGRMQEDERAVAGYAAQMLHWRATSGFCPVCGQATGPHAHDWGCRCPACGHARYPLVTPAVLVLVHRAGKILLSHKPGWGEMRSILAGFVEPGETLEECAARETFEEVGLRVTEIRYRGSQSWPFPHQLMVGFTARALEGEIRIDAEELDAADWYGPDEMPGLPSPASLSRQLIDAWLAEAEGRKA